MREIQMTTIPEYHFSLIGLIKIQKFMPDFDKALTFQECTMVQHLWRIISQGPARKRKHHTRYLKQRGFDRENMFMKGPRDQKGETEVTETLVTGGRSYYFHGWGEGTQWYDQRQTQSHGCITELAARGTGTTQKMMPNQE